MFGEPAAEYKMLDETDDADEIGGPTFTVPESTSNRPFNVKSAEVAPVTILNVPPFAEIPPLIGIVNPPEERAIVVGDVNRNVPFKRDTPPPPIWNSVVSIEILTRESDVVPLFTVILYKRVLVGVVESFSALLYVPLNVSAQ